MMTYILLFFYISQTFALIQQKQEPVYMQHWQPSKPAKKNTWQQHKFALIQQKQEPLYMQHLQPSKPAQKGTWQEQVLQAREAVNLAAEKSDNLAAEKAAVQICANEPLFKKSAYLMAARWKVLQETKRNFESLQETKPIMNRVKFSQPATTHEQSPITDESIWKSWHHSYGQNEFRLNRAMQKLNGNGTFNIVVLGGSITSGHGCELKNNWVSTLQGLLQSNFGTRVNVTNLAEPGTTSAFISTRWKKVENLLNQADLIVVEYHYNDFKGPSSLKKTNNVTAYMLMSLPKKPAVLYLDIPPFGPFMDSTDVFPPVEKSVHFDAAKKFGIPIVWFSDAVRESGNLYLPMSEKFTVKEKVKDEFHPACFPSHHVMASLINGVLQQATQQVCERGVQGNDVPLTAPDNEKQIKCLQRPKFEAFASSGEKGFPIKSAGKWSFEEDRPGKPGWIAPAGTPTEIVFKNIPIEYGILGFEFLRTYNNIGSVTCTLEGKSAPIAKLDGLWQFNVSLSDTVFVSDLPRGKHNIHCITDGAKFKLTGLLSC